MKALVIFVVAVLGVVIYQIYRNDCYWQGFAAWDRWAECVVSRLY